ncbi:hypothetical protein [Nocardia sp. NPDC004860]|uniref:hypothetical protein n=1 Tax=Nocardia sp. NPDC004860 TaxID=3154557 RepID=UPI0033B0FA4C
MYCTATGSGAHRLALAGSVWIVAEYRETRRDKVGFIVFDSVYRSWAEDPARFWETQAHEPTWSRLVGAGPDNEKAPLDNWFTEGPSQCRVLACDPAQSWK